jgi:hypothetical protein
MIKLDNVSCEVIKIKMFPYSLGEKALNWFLDFPLGTSHSWLNLKSAFTEIFGLHSVISYNKEFYFHSNNKMMSGLFMLGKDLEALLMDGNTVLEIG